MKLKVTIMAALLIIATGMVSASAFTSATLDRDATFLTSGDQDALINVSDTHNSGIVAYDAESRLEVDVTATGASGANKNASFTFGDAQGDSAFNLSHQFNTAQDVTFEYTFAGDAATLNNDTGSVVFEVYHENDLTNTAGTMTANASEATDGAVDASQLIGTLNPGEEYVVVIQLETGTEDLSGTLTVDVQG